MPTVYRHERFRFVIWPNDHSPPHVHAFTPGGEAIVDLTTGEVRSFEGMTLRDAAEAVRIVLETHELLMAKWRKIHG